MKKAFYFIFKALFVLKIFCLDFLVTYKKGLIRGNFKIYDVTTWLTNISRRKDNQTKKVGQLIDYNMRNIFPEESSTK